MADRSEALKIFIDIWHGLDPVKPHLDVAAVGLLLLTLTDLIPKVTVWLTFFWVCLRLYETATIQAWLARRRQRKEKP